MFDLYLNGEKVDTRNYQLLINGSLYTNVSQFTIGGKVPSGDIIIWSEISSEGGPVNGTQIKSVEGGPVNGTQIKSSEGGPVNGTQIKSRDGGPVNGTQIKGVVVNDVSSSMRYENSIIRTVDLYNGSEKIDIYFKIVINN
ncbi:MAG: hypothetical protein SLAVMIC_00538 [uncultured marine phage]|uniref:Uncharacterized protein n=1 Tax=uncultured marine phage TaxID=707152 RepID=A0A8D9FR61_9VIRU|nr:MAG: hypothetical protein SLAVMIC_00538 [uncultured marine phage]